MNRNLLIIGAGGHGKVVGEIALKMNRWKKISYIDDNYIKESMGIKVVGNIIDAYDRIESNDIFVAIGNNGIREQIQNKFESIGASIPIIIHPSAIIGKKVKVGNGTVVMAGTVINCCTTIGKGCIVNTSSTIDHDCVIEDYVHICPGVNLAGTVKVGKRVWLGIGSVISNNIKICSDCKLGAGAVVVKDLNDKGTYVGVPVKKIR